MALRLSTAATTAPCCPRRCAQGKTWTRIAHPGNLCPNRERGRALMLSALPETAISAVVAVIAVGAAATLLRRSPEASPDENSSLAVCEDCGGSGICSLCRGEGFVLKQLSDESAEKARLTAKNMATRYTAGLPKKWTYCNKCSASRSCVTCKGAGKIFL